MNTLKRLYRSLPARILAALVLASIGMVLSDLYVQTDIWLAMLGMLLILGGLALIPGFGAADDAPTTEESRTP